MSEITLREGIALLLGLAAAVLLIVTQVISLRHAFLALKMVKVAPLLPPTAY